MMQWLRNNPPPVMERRVVEPGATFSLFENHWKQATDVMASSEDAEAALTVISHLSQMIAFLRISRAELNTETTCKGFWLRNQCSEKVIKWLHKLQLKGLLLPADHELKLVEVLHSLCQVASRDGELLGYEDENMDKQDWDGAYSLASLLLEYSLRSDPQLGDTARYSFILLIQLASRFSKLEKSLTQESGLGLTNVVISGLSACFSQLPTFQDTSPEQLQAFIVQLKFVEEVTEAASENVASTIAECFKHAFLDHVILPALTQDEGSRSLHSEHDSYLTSLHEEIAIVTKYLQIVCEQLTHPYLNRSIIQFITSKLLPTLVQRLNHMNVSITVATLRLFTVLFEFYCEDFWHAVILRYLLPLNHLMVSQRDVRLPEIDFHDSCVRFLALIPVTVTDALGSETLTKHYVQYLNSESERMANIDSMVSSAPSISFHNTKSQTVQPNVSDENDRTIDLESTNRNAIYPFWKYKYDGTDSLEKGGVGRKSSIQEVKQFEPEPVKCESEETSSTKVQNDPLTSPLPELEFTTINLLHQGSEDNENSTTQVPSACETKLEIGSLSVVTSSSEGYASMDSSSSPMSEGTSTNAQQASFGPFLDLLLVQLSSWENQNPDISLVLSELVSVLASSRIPLLNTILLDPNLTLQPSYVTFMSLLKRIREDLDFRMKTNCPPKVILEVWQSMDSSSKPPATSTPPRRTSLTSSANTSISPFSSPSSFIGDNFGENILKGFKSFMNRKSGSPVAASSPKPNQPSQGHKSPSQGDQSEVAKILAKRAIIFSHWLLELGAIAQQLCWKRK